MQFIKTLIIGIGAAIGLSSCNQAAMSQNDETGLYATEQFKDYWYAGKAEVNAYNLDQSRYGENRPGKA
ncbi:MAG: hypothetical protein RIA63_09970, partial [Cyclobacteriaceae bacterium]